jgi:hypothetical protein
VAVAAEATDIKKVDGPLALRAEQQAVQASLLYAIRYSQNLMLRNQKSQAMDWY